MEKVPSPKLNPPSKHKTEVLAALAGVIVLTIGLPIAIDQGYFRYNSYVLPLLGLAAVALYLGLIFHPKSIVWIKAHKVLSSTVALLLAIGAFIAFKAAFLTSRKHVAEQMARDRQQSETKNEKEAAQHPQRSVEQLTGMEPREPQPSGKSLLNDTQQTPKTGQPTDDDRRDEIFYKALKDLDSSVPTERASAVSTLADLGVHSIKRRQQAVQLFIIRLQQESDLTVIELLSRSIGRSALDILASKNRQLSEHLATATGRLLGTESVLGSINVTNGSGGPPTLDELMTAYLFKQLPVEISRTSLFWQDASASDIGFFQRPDRLKIQPAFRAAFEQIAKARQSAQNDETDAEKEFHVSIHDLWINTQAIVSMLRSLPGRFVGANLTNTTLIHPHLAELDLRGIDARSSIWMAPIFRSADLRYANLSNSEMKYADLQNANLTGADIAGVNFGQQDKSLEGRTLATIRFLQSEVNLDGTNLWDLAKCYLKDQQFDPAKLQEFKKRRQEILVTPNAKKYLSKIPKNR
jgi:uncharacterized protein YjbI with pentapeptide repeats